MLLNPYISYDSGVWMNVALQDNGGNASASSTAGGGGFQPSFAIDGIRHTANSWGTGGGWSSSGAVPQDITVEFGQLRNVQQVDLFFLDDSTNYVDDPGPSDIGTAFVESKFHIDYWDGLDWVQIPETVVDNSELIWVHLTFSPINTDRLRLTIEGSMDGFAQVVEFEAWGFN